MASTEGLASANAWIWPVLSHQHKAASFLWPFRACPNWCLKTISCSTFEVKSRQKSILLLSVKISKQYCENNPICWRDIRWKANTTTKRGKLGTFCLVFCLKIFLTWSSGRQIPNQAHPCTCQSNPLSHSASLDTDKDPTAAERQHVGFMKSTREGRRYLSIKDGSN